MNDQDVVNAMRVYGGNFIRHLAETFLAADSYNQQRIKAAFDREWRHYAALAEEAAHQRRQP